MGAFIPEHTGRVALEYLAFDSLCEMFRIGDIAPLQRVQHDTAVLQCLHGGAAYRVCMYVCMYVCM